MIVFLETEDCLLIPIKKSIMLLVSYVLYCLKTVTEGSWNFLMYFRVVDQQMRQLFALGAAIRAVFPWVILAQMFKLKLEIQCVLLL